MSNNIKQLRTERKLTLQSLSEKTGIQKGTLASYESKGVTPRGDKASILARFFGVSESYLLGLSKFENESELINEALDTGQAIFSILGFSIIEKSNNPDEIPDSSNELYNLTQEIEDIAFNLEGKERDELGSIIYNFLLLSNEEREDLVKYSEFVLSKRGYIAPNNKNN